MINSILIVVFATTALYSCAQSSRPAPDASGAPALDSARSGSYQEPLKASYERYINSKHEYNSTHGVRLVIENSFPKSGGNYTDPNGNNYVYAVFWTRIINEAGTPLGFTIDFPVDSFEIPSGSGNYMQLFIPSDTLTQDKASLYDYGLDVKTFLNTRFNSSSALKRTINPNESFGFYVVTLSNRGVNGTIRTGFSLQGQDLFYRINEIELPSGKTDFKY